MLRSATPLPRMRLDNPCAACPVSHWAICQPVVERDLDVVERFKSGERTVPTGTDLYSEGEPWHELYTVLSGWLYYYKLLEDGRRQITKIVLPGDFVGFQPDLSGRLDHSAQTLTEVRLCVFPRDNFLKLCKAHPELALRLAWMVARDVESAVEGLTSIGRRSARERVAHFLLGLYYRVRLHDPNAANTSIAMPLTQEHIGDALGLTAVHVNRTLRGLRNDGLLQVSNRTLQVLEPDRLADVAGIDEDTLERWSKAI